MLSLRLSACGNDSMVVNEFRTPYNTTTVATIDQTP